MGRCLIVHVGKGTRVCKATLAVGVCTYTIR